jgi:uncharacterized protein YbaP (TraB family)
MSRWSFRNFSFFLIALGANFVSAKSSAATACVWKLTGPGGKILYFGGAVHALQQSDYPLPAAYLQAFDASSRLAVEIDTKGLEGLAKAWAADGKYRHGDSLKNHVDPRTYQYLRRLFGLMNVPEETFAQYRPWFIVEMLQSTAVHKELPEVGVDEFFMRRAAKRSMSVIGLESMQEHARVFSGLSDRESEILLLTTFIPNSEGLKRETIMAAWHRGDADALTRMTQSGFREFPAFGERLLDARNRAWVPRIENFLESGQTYFVVVGSAHFGGSNGLLALLRAKGYQIEQL